MDDGYWFVPKAHGYGAVPSSWQGWACVAAAVAVIAVLAFAALGSGEPTLLGLVVFVAGTLVTVAALVLVARAKTRGGWRWRRGSEQ